MVQASRVIVQENGCTAIVTDQYVKGAIVIVVANGQSAGGEHLLERRAGLCADIGELPVSALMEKQHRFLVMDLLRVVIDHVVRVAVGKDEINRSIVVVVEKLQAPAAEQARGLGDAVEV